jgi:hypothetical protein
MEREYEEIQRKLSRRMSANATGMGFISPECSHPRGPKG